MNWTLGLSTNVVLNFYVLLSSFQFLTYQLIQHISYLPSLLNTTVICACVSHTGALFARLLPMYRGQRARERWAEHGGSFERHVRAAPDSQAEHEYLRGAGKRAPEENQLAGTPADEQLKTQGMNSWAWKYLHLKSSLQDTDTLYMININRITSWLCEQHIDKHNLILLMFCTFCTNLWVVWLHCVTTFNFWASLEKAKAVLPQQKQLWKIQNVLGFFLALFEHLYMQNPCAVALLILTAAYFSNPGSAGAVH